MFTLSNTVLVKKNKQGILKPDSDGYYTIVLGALNSYNSAGEYYVYKGAEELFLNSSQLMQRIKKGALYSELGHPKPQPGQDFKSFYIRARTIEETNICAHIKEVWLDKEYGRNNPELGNPEMIAVMGKVAPAGPHGDSFKRSMENPAENVAFSVRGITNNYRRNGRIERVFEEIITWDRVVEPGIAIATKYNSPALEDLYAKDIMPEEFRKVVTDIVETRPVALENSLEIERRLLAKMSCSGNKLFHW